MKHVIHVHQAKIKKNQTAIINRTYKGSTHHRKIDILCDCGCDKVAATITQSEKPDKCGARVVLIAEKVKAYE